MQPKSFPKAAILLLPVLGLATPASGQDEAFELWFNPTFGTDLDDDTSVEIETAQRFRSEADGRVDTYFVRGWLKQDIATNASLSGAVEYRANDGGSNELRTIQQLSTSHGFIKTRLRLEQRFVDGADRMGLRLRPRLGVGFDLSQDGRWSTGADVEIFWTLRGNNVGSETGITAIRTTVGVEHEINDNLTLGLFYLRQQDFEDNAPDEIGHAPLLVADFSF